MSGEPQYTVRSAFKVALIAGGLGASVALLIWFEAPSWTWIAIAAFCAVVGIVFLAALGHRDPEARLRSFVVRTVVLLGAMLVAKATAGLTVDAAGKLDVAPVLSASGRVAAGAEWYVDVAFLGAGLVLLYLAMRAVARRPATEVPAPSRTSALRDEAPPAPAPPLPEVFHDRVRMLFERRAFTTFHLPDYHPEPGCLVGECRDDRGMRQVVVRCDDRGVEVAAADLDAVAAYAASRPGGAEARVCYTTPGARTISADLQARFPQIECVSEEALLHRLVHFDSYLRRVIERYEQDRLPYSTSTEKRTLAETFVAPRYTLQRAAAEPTRTGLREHLDAWLADPRPRQIALLADYGMGKSSFLKHYAAYLARRRLDGEGSRIPILLSLTGKSPRTSPGIEGLVQAFIAQYQLRCEFTAFELLMKAGRLVFLIDAFDEMDLVGDRGMRLAHFAELWRLHVPGNKLLFAGRPTFFPDEDELREALHIAALSSERMTGRGWCERVSLAPLQDEDIKSSFARYFAPDEGARHFAWVRGNQRLLELARRPAMMHIIRDTIEELRAGGADSIALREAALLKLYTDHWIERQVEGSEPVAVGSAAHTPRRQLLVGREVRARFSENLAVWMFANARSDVKSSELGELFVEWFPEEAERVASGGAPGAPGARPQLLQRAHLIEGIETDLRNCTFLSGDHEGRFAFAHKPFFEYFIAAAIDRCLREKRHLPGSLQARPWSTEISLHVADLWLLRRRGEDATDDDARWVFKVLTQRSARGNYTRPVDDLHPTLEPPRPPYPSEGRPARWRRTLARILSLTSFFDAWAGSPQMRGLQVLLRGGVLYVWIERRLFSRVLGRLGGIAHSPRCLERLELARARLDSAHLEGLDFSARSLVGASFSNASIHRCRFDRADLSDASFQRARLEEASFVHATLHRARFERAVMVACRFDRADAREARFDWASMSRGGMRFMSARRSSLRGAWLSGDLRGLDALDADLTETETRLSDITAALFPSGRPPTTELIPALLRHATSVGWSPDDTMLLALDRDSAWLLSAGRGAPLRRILDPAGSILAAAFRSETELVTVSGAGATIHDLSGHERRGVRLDGTPHRVALDPSGTWLAAASGSTVLVARCDGEAKPWTASLGSEIRELAVASDGQFFVASLEEEVWIAFAGGSTRLVTGSDLGSEVLIDPKGAWLAVVGAETSEIYLVSAFVRPAPHAPEVHGRVDRVHRRRPIASLPVRLVACSPDGAHVLGLRGGTEIVSWSCETWKEERSIVVPMFVMGPAAYAHTTDELAVIGKYEIVVFDFAREGTVCTLVPFASDFYNIFQDGNRLTVSFADEETLSTKGLMGAHRWNLRELRSETPPRRQQPSVELVLEEGVPSEPAFGDPFSAMPEPGGAVIGTGPRRLAYLRHAEDREGNSAVEVYETDGRQMLASIPVGSSAAHASFRGDGGALAFASDDHLIVFDLADQREFVRSALPGISAVAYSPDGATVAAGDEAGRLHVLDVTSGSKREALHAGGAKISAIAAVADSPVFLAAADGTLWSWMPGADRVEIFSGPVPGTTDLAVSPDGRLLATVSRDDIVRVWSIADRKLVASLYHLVNGWAVVRGDGKYRYGGEVWQLASSRGLCAYHLEDLDALIPDQRF